MNISELTADIIELSAGICIVVQYPKSIQETLNIHSSGIIPISVFFIPI